jgi:hypothetical protein
VDLGDVSLLWDFDEFEEESPSRSYGIVREGDAALQIGDDSIFFGQLWWADQPTGPSNSFTGARHFLDAQGSETALIDHFTEFESAFDLDSATASAIPSSFNSALDDFESARGNELLRASGGEELCGDTGAGGKALALADVLSGFESDSEAEVLQLFEAGSGSAVAVEAGGSAGGASFAPVASFGGGTGADLESLIGQGNVEVA